ncbi:MAG: hypothetical protein ACOVQE_09555 [Chitinophagaceae bacterium]
MILEKIYTVLSYLLLPFVILFGIADLLMLPMAFVNIKALLPVFLLACLVMYFFFSFYFLQKGIHGKQTLKPSLKDYIKVNAFVTLVFCVFNGIQLIQVLMMPTVKALVIEQALQMSAKGMAPYSKEFVLKIFNISMVSIAIFFSLMLVHVIVSFRFLKQYRHLFMQKD